jgi:hypothetical protein
MHIRKDKKLSLSQLVVNVFGKSGQSMYSRKDYKSLFKSMIVESYGLYQKLTLSMVPNIPSDRITINS